MNYIFIDIDGVLNSQDYILSHIDEDIAIDDRPVKLLSELAHKYSAKIILSSSWRRHYTENGELRDGDYPKERDLYLIQTLYKYNIAILGRTRIGISKYGDPYDEGNRAEEIQDFINKNLVEGDNYVIFDDEAFGGNINVFERMAELYEKAGYVLPKLVFWNVNSRTNTVPTLLNKTGVIYVSGFSGNIVDMVMSGKTDPFEALVEKLSVARYADIPLLTIKTATIEAKKEAKTKLDTKPAWL